MRAILSTAAMAMLSAAFAASAGPATQVPPPGRLQLLFLADPQVHNVQGVALKQMFPTADWVSKVAIRPPELNLLAPLALRDALQAGQAVPGNTTDLVVVLGDGTNIACSGEADAFDREFARARPGTVRLMAHGNHDSYLMGTVNSYGPWGTNTRPPTPPGEFPVDEAWWNPTDAPTVTGGSGFGRNWLDACYRPAADGLAAGTPMNKPRWLARYLDSLKPHGLELHGEGSAPHDGRRFSAAARPGTALAALNYRALGTWYAPRPSAHGRDADYARAWNSFLVQAADVGERHTLVLIDTSVCQNARGGLAFLWSNAGTSSCVGDAQFEAIARLLAQLPAGREVVFAGHFPLKGLGWQERRRLKALMRQASPQGWTYVSGHTHDAMHTRPYRYGIDLNIGSTTDWPMESHVLRFDGPVTAAAHASNVLATREPELAYVAGRNLAGRYSELCRHAGAARALATATPAMYEATWTSPSMDEAACSAIQRDWRANAEALVRDQALISERFDNETDYRRFVLRVAAAASHHGDRQFDLIP